MKIGFIGLGKMGSAMATNLLKAGHNVTVYNRTSCDHRQLPEAIANQYHASSRGGPRHHGNFPDNVDTRARTVTCLRAELSPCLCNESSPEGRCANLSIWSSATESPTSLQS
jgi:glycerol-3-phosphate dehydrogenase